MKNKFIKILATVMAVMALTACGKNEETPNIEETPLAKQYTVYAPDGAPALALANAIDKASEEEFAFNIVDATTIQALVTGETPMADFCIMPVNLASKLLGSGEVYKLMGVVTNGNMYFLTTGNNDPFITEYPDELAGKTVGVVQLSNVPGLTLQAVLKEKGIPYSIIENLEVATADVLNLMEVEAATGVTPAGGCDYYLCPEPAASTKIAKTEGKLKLAGDLQALYGEGGYPQAVLVVKNEVIENDPAAVAKMELYMAGSAQFMADTDASAVVELLGKAYTDGMMPSFNAENLTDAVIAHCNVEYKPAADNAEFITEFLTKVMEINPKAASEISPEFLG